MDPFITGCQLAFDIRTGRQTSVAATEHYIKRIETLDKDTNLVVVRMFASARQRALEADTALINGQLWGRLHGVPLTIKECFATRGVQTVCGNARYAELSDGKPYLPDINSAVVEKLLAAGAVLLGKTNLSMDEADIQSYNEIYGTSRNPWNLAYTPGGSSGGSAGAVAAGLTPLEVGADIGGSIRTPAHFCGVCGHKPSQGIIDKSGKCPPYPLSLRLEDLSVVGPFGRSCDDLSLMMDVLVGPTSQHAAGGWSLQLPSTTATSIEGLRVAVWADDPFCETDTEYVALLHAVADTLRAGGASVDHAARPAMTFEDMFAVFRGNLGPSLRGQGVPLRAANQRLKLKRKWEAFWDSGFDVLLCPVTTGSAFPIDESGGNPGMASRTVVVNGKERPYLDNLRWAGLTIIADLPVTVVPIGVLPSCGLPVGVQIVGREWHDRTTLEVGRMLERANASCRVQPPPAYFSQPARL